ncbi:MAG: metallophosphoesterase [Planctomycetota bacterium]
MSAHSSPDHHDASHAQEAFDPSEAPHPIASDAEELNYDPAKLDAALDLADAASVVAYVNRCAERCRDQSSRRGSSIHLGDSGRLVVTGDLHDNGPNLQRIVHLAKLAESPDHHLILHEVIHGENLLHDADLSIRTLARVAELKVKYPAQVHLLQSNHELAQRLGESILKDGISSVDAFTTGLDYLYNDHAGDVADAVNAYVDALALCVRCSNGVLIAHSLPAPRRIEDFDKGVIDRTLTEEDLRPRGSAYDMVWGRYHNRKITQELAEAWGASAFLLGHQPADMGYEPLADNALILASDHGHGQACVIDLAESYSRDQLIERLVPLNSIRF